MPVYYAPFRGGEIPVRVRFIREPEVNYSENEWDFDGPITDATDAECEAIQAWVAELKDDDDDY